MPVTMSKKDYINAIIPHLRGMDMVGTNCMKWYNPLTWSGFITTRLTQCIYSHVFLVASDRVHGYTTGASGFPDFKYGAVDLAKYLNSQDQFIIRRNPNLSDHQVAIGEHMAQGLFGDKYPVMEPVSMVVQNIFAPGKVELLWNTHGRICSDCVTHIYSGMGSPLNPQIPQAEDMRTPYNCLSDGNLETIAVWPFDSPSMGKELAIQV